MSWTKNRDHNPILITGSHRSGTTWIGRIISEANGVGWNIPEPFSLNHRMGVLAYQFENWFAYYEDEDQSLLKKCMEDCINYNYYFAKEIVTLQSFRDLGRMIRDSSHFFYHQLNRSRPIIKDPIAITSIEWLVKHFDMQPIIMIRHPAAFVSSLKKADWSHDFNSFLRQPKLMERLNLFRQDIERMAAMRNATNIEQGVLLWNIIYHLVKEYQEKYPEWCYMRHEDISYDPTHEFKKIFSYLNLDFSDKVKGAIVSSSSSNNSIEAKKQNHTKINSKVNISAWKRRLTDEETSFIKNGTKLVWPDFYSEEEWDL